MKYNEYRSFLIKILILIGVLWVLFLIFQIYNVILIFIFAIFLNILFAPFLNKLNKKKIPDWLWIILVYLLLLLVIIIMFVAIVPIFTDRIWKVLSISINYINTIQYNYKTEWIDWLWLPSYIVNNFSWMLLKIDFANILNSIKSNFMEISNIITKNLSSFIIWWFWIVSSITWAILNMVLTFAFAFFIALERKEIKKFCYDIIPKHISKYLNKKEDLIMFALNHWLKWQLLLCLSIFMFTVIWLNVIRIFWVNISFWETITLWVIAWLMEFIPYIWPILSLIPAIAIAWSLWFQAIIIVIILYLIIQQIENNILVPIIMSKSVKLSPFAVFFAMSIWASLFWILWILIAIPIVSIIQIFLNDYIKAKR